MSYQPESLSQKSIWEYKDLWRQLIVGGAHWNVSSVDMYKPADGHQRLKHGYAEASTGSPAKKKKKLTKLGS